ncbi:MAG TPA: imidazole glycerol phosphate synthase subunit HisH [Candidatus Acidoferrum sp.]|nr:imidazole glycerol phosphate synthase subunit HisH [Candidatus Acidoferrum sp.]
MTPASKRRPLVGIVDYGAGNIVSVSRGLEIAGAEARLIRRPEDLGDVELLVVPGVGAAAPAMARLEAAGLVDPIRAWLEADRWFLGICLGLQLLFDGSDEDGAETLGAIRGRTRILSGGARLPHIGWNQVERHRDHPTFEEIPDGADFYFVHSYAGRPEGPTAGELVLAETTDGSSFVSAVAGGRMLGVQFHPERSGPCGLRFLGNVVDLVRRDAAVEAAGASPGEAGAPAVEVAASAVQVAAPAVESVV